MFGMKNLNEAVTCAFLALVAMCVSERGVAANGEAAERRRRRAIVC